MIKQTLSFILALCSVIFFSACSNGAKAPATPAKTNDLVYFEYKNEAKYTYEGEKPTTYKMAYEDGKAVVTFYNAGDNIDLVFTPDSTFRDELAGIINRLKLSEWDGFEGYNSEALDGSVWELTIRYPGSEIYATGDNAMPDNYHNAIDALHQFFLSYAEQETNTSL